MNLHLGRWIGFAALVLASGITMHAAEPPVRSRGTPIIFSAPSTSDTVSSNLNELRTPSTPFRDIEAELKKPFEAFDPIHGGSSSRPLSRQTPPVQQPEMNKRTLKEQMNQRAEQMFLTPELFEGEDDYLLSEESLDPYKQKPRTALDRYYDRMDRNRLAPTNRPAGDDLLGGKIKDRPDDFGVAPKAGNGLDPEPNATARILSLISNSSPASERYFSERARLAPSSSNPFEAGTADAFNRKQSPQETRQEDFKRLLEGPSYKSRAGSAAPLADYGTTKPSSTALTPSYTWSSSPKPTTTPSPNAFATSAGLVGAPGTPQGLPEFSASSLSTPPPPPLQAKPMPPSTFNIPRRRF